MSAVTVGWLVYEVNTRGFNVCYARHVFELASLDVLQAVNPPPTLNTPTRHTKTVANSHLKMNVSIVILLLSISCVIKRFCLDPNEYKTFLSKETGYICIIFLIWELQSNYARFT